MGALSNIEIVRLIQEATARGDYEAGAAYYKDDFTLREAPSLPYGGDYRGGESLASFIEKHHQTWSEHAFEVLCYVDAGDDQVICLVKLHATSRATGRTLEMQVTEWWTLKDGRVVDIHEFYFDTAAVLAAITP